MTGDALARRVRRLEDREAIASLVHAYCDRFDRGDADGVAALFTVEARIDYNPDTACPATAEKEDV